MTIQKPDFNQIFASQAPDVDKPPVFKNYNGGWGDESRPNNGKPTINGFNFIQQLNDNKFLWMAQNGAFPYDPKIEYNVGIVTLKDGRFKQWNGADWINFGQDDSALKSAKNLSDLPNKAIARTNLEVYSKKEVDNAIPPKTPDATETVAGKAKIATTAIAKAGTNDTDFITPLKLRGVLFGVGQTWQNVTGQRKANTLYTNTMGRTIFIYVANRDTSAITNVSATVTIGGANIPINSGGAGTLGSWKTVSGFFPIPDGVTYACNAFFEWWEFR